MNQMSFCTKSFFLTFKDFNKCCANIFPTVHVDYSLQNVYVDYSLQNVYDNYQKFFVGQITFLNYKITKL